MSILTLTTDWGLHDHYLASFKGQVLGVMPTVQMIDITHLVEKYNTMQAAYIIQNSFQNFPPGSIHFIGVSGNENHETNNPFLVVKYNGQFLLGEDNGMFTLILGNEEKEIVRLSLQKDTDQIKLNKELIETIKKISEGESLSNLGKKENNLREYYFAKPTVDNQTIRGTVIYIDSYGNAIVNVKRDLFIQEKRNREFTIHFRKAVYNVNTISNHYEDVEMGEMLALFNQDGFLEIALNKESATNLLGLKLMDPIRIEFNDSTAG